MKPYQQFFPRTIVNFLSITLMGVPGVWTMNLFQIWPRKLQVRSRGIPAQGWLPPRNTCVVATQRTDSVRNGGQGLPPPCSLAIFSSPRCSGPKVNISEGVQLFPIVWGNTGSPQLRWSITFWDVHATRMPWEVPWTGEVYCFVEGKQKFGEVAGKKKCIREQNELWNWQFLNCWVAWLFIYSVGDAAHLFVSGHDTDESFVWMTLSGL